MKHASNITLGRYTWLQCSWLNISQKILLPFPSNWELGASIPGRSWSTRAGALLFPTQALLLLHPAPSDLPSTEVFAGRCRCSPASDLRYKSEDTCARMSSGSGTHSLEMCEMNRGSTNLLCWEVALTVILEFFLFIQFQFLQVSRHNVVTCIFLNFIIFVSFQFSPQELLSIVICICLFYPPQEQHIHTGRRVWNSQYHFLQCLYIWACISEHHN